MKWLAARDFEDLLQVCFLNIQQEARDVQLSDLTVCHPHLREPPF